MADLERAREIVEDLENAYPTLPWGTVVENIAAALAAVREEDAQAVNGLIGRDSGNWNRAIAYAVDAIRKGER